MITDVADRAQELKFMVNRMYGEMDEGEEDAEEPLGLEVLKVCVQDDHSTEEPAGWVVG